MKRKFRPLEKWHGIDASNEISLFEYGILFRNTTEGLQVIYKWYGHDEQYRYSYSWFNADDFWCKDSWVDFGRLYEFSQTTMDFYIFNPEQFCSDLYGCYGDLNIFGTDYSGGYTEKEIRTRLNKAL